MKQYVYYIYRKHGYHKYLVTENAKNKKVNSEMVNAKENTATAHPIYNSSIALLF